MSWQETDFENLYSIPSKNGLNRPARVRGAGYKLINMGELFANDRIGNIDMERVPMNDRELASMLVEKGDLLFARQSLVLAGAGKCSIVKEVEEPTTFESHIIRVRLNRDLAHPEFYHYYFKSPVCRIRSIVTQGVQAGIRGNDLRKLKVHCPPLEEQEYISDVLSAYDDLIDNNRRRIQLLEESARLLYKEWFVHLRFPGHEHAKIKDGVPEGWEKTTAFEAMDILSGGTPSTKNPDYWDGDIPFYTPKDYTDSPYVFETERNMTDRGLANCNSKLYQKDTVFISARGTVGKIIMPQRPMAMSQTSYALLGKNGVTQFFLYFSLQIGLYQLQQRATGAVFDAIVVDTFKSIPFMIPPEKLIDSFEEIASPVLSQIENLLLTNQRLAQARDLLLPRLMNGEVKV